MVRGDLSAFNPRKWRAVCKDFLTRPRPAYIIAFAMDETEVCGHPGQWTTRADSGQHATRYFCSKCGSSMYSHHHEMDKRVFVNGGESGVGGGYGSERGVQFG